MLNFERVRKSYGRVSVLQIDTLSIKPGITWVQGANGSGKSTLLKTIAGMLDFSGDIAWNGCSVKRHAVQYRRLVNFADAEPIFPPFVTGRELSDLFSQAKHAPTRQAVPLVNEMGMEAYIDEPVATYSSGMVKKLSLVLAFLGNPQLILLDEPLITLDAAALPVLYRWINEYRNRYDASFLVSSHHPLDLPRPGDTLLVQDKTVTYPA